MSAEPGAVRRAARRVAGGLIVTTVAALGLAVTYVTGGQSQVEGVLLALALGGLGYAFVVASRYLLPQGPDIEEREPLESSREEQLAFTADFEALVAPGEPLARRKFLLRMFGAAAGALGIAALFPIASLGPNPGTKLKHTRWRRGVRVINEQGEPVHVDDLEVGGVITVFPDGARDAADAQTLLIRVSGDPFTTRPGREDWAPRGYVAYSKICTHAGCPVGLYQHQIKRLLCPCHQSTFDVLDGARPIFGPAARSLPQLPLSIDSEGYLRAQDDYDEPVGPGFWDRGR
jgi:ubiquinol-cytochrome c reductase iron-sulfur subunit